MKYIKKKPVKVKNEYGTEVFFNAAMMLMDDELVSFLEPILGFEPEQEFFDAYCEAHLEKYGEPFELAKENPCY